MRAETKAAIVRASSRHGVAMLCETIDHRQQFGNRDPNPKLKGRK